MANESDRTDPGAGDLEGPLIDIDSDLNIFALANGLDLYRNRSGRPDRVLEWYREGMERRIVLGALGGERFAITVGASRTRGGVTEVATRAMAEVDAAELKGGLRGFLADGIERANEISEAELQPAE